MAAKAAQEHSILAAAGSEVQTVDHYSPSEDVSDTESFHSTPSRTQKKPSPTRRRTTGDPNVGNIENVLPQARAGTWPRSIRSVSHQQPHQRPAVPNRQSSRFSSSSQQRPDLRTLHRESCQLFSSMDAAIIDSGYSSIHRSGSSRVASTASFQQLATPAETPPRCSATVSRPPLSTVISWKSDDARRIEYLKIDGAHSGLRGLCKKILPKCCRSRRSWRGFFEGKCDGDSVRRMRMPFSDDEKANS